MAEYGPDGAYPEGPGYWDYGITFNVLLIAALESALGSDFGLAAMPGFLASADYYQHVVGPTGRSFNYADCSDGVGIQPAMFWFAARRSAPHLLWSELQRCEPFVQGDGTAKRGLNRLFPLLLVWAPPPPDQRAPPATRSWSGGGPTPVAMHRSAWTTDATWVAIKGGSPSTSHGHMDVGTFVMDADGVRWAADLGMQEYHSLESKQVDLWNMKQDSQRWRIFQLGASSHNILTVDGRQQVVQGRAPIVRSKPGLTVIDTGAVYQGQLAAARRGVALLPDRSVVLQDEITAGAAATVRWAMLTPADVTVTGPGRAELAQLGKTLAFRVIEPAQAEVRTWSTDPPTEFDAPNPGTRLIGFEITLTAGAAQRIVVQLAPAGTDGPVEVKPLLEW